MATSMISARDKRQSVQFFDVDMFRNKLENYMRKQATEMCEVVNNKKRKLNDRWTDVDKEEMELAQDYRDDLCYQFGKRPRGDSYYPIDDDEVDHEEVSPLVLPSPVSVPIGDFFLQSQRPQSYFEPQPQSMAYSSEDAQDSNPMSMAMRRHLSGYSEASSISASYTDDADDSWMSPCPPLSRASLSASSASSVPDTPNNGPSSEAGDEHPMTDVEHSDALHLTQNDLDLDFSSMAPHERNLLAALAPERFEKAALIKHAFRQSDKVLDQFVREPQTNVSTDTEMVSVDMDDGEYDQVFGELMHV